MPKSPEKTLREFRKVFHQSIPEQYNIDYIELPPSHPDLNQSIYISGILDEIIKSNNIYNTFVSNFEKFDLHNRYYLCVYYLSLDYSSNIKHSYLYEKLYKNYFEYKVGYLPNPYVDDFIQKNKQIVSLNSFIESEMENLKTELRKLYIQPKRNRFQFILKSGEDIELSDFRIDISAAHTKYQYQIRKELSPRLDSAKIELLIHNSFIFPGNNFMPSIISLDYGDSNEMGEDFHMLYKEYAKIIETPRLEKFHFALLMFCTFAYVRHNWEDYKIKNPDASLSQFLKTSVVHYIRS